MMRPAGLVDPGDQLIRGSGHRRDVDRDLIAVIAGARDPFRDRSNPIEIGNRCAAIFLYDQSQRDLPSSLFLSRAETTRHLAKFDAGH